MTDGIFEAFLARQLSDGLALADASDLVDLLPVGDQERPAKYLARYRCRGLIDTGASIEIADRFDVGIRFPPNYLRRVNSSEVLTWLGPRNVFHPNIGDQLPFICVGRLDPGTSLVDLLYQLYEIISWQKVTMREDDALNSRACVWARGHRERFPVDRRPLRRPALTAGSEGEEGRR